MDGFQKITIRFVLLVVIVATAGCTTYVGKVKKLDGYNKKINKVTVSWVNPSKIKTRIKASGQRGVIISSKVKEASMNGIKTLLSLFREHGISMVSEALGNHSVTTVSYSESPLHRLVLTAVQAETECVPLGCTHNLWIYARILDADINKSVWSASFLVGKPFADKSDKKTLANFVSTLIGELKEDKMI